MKIVLTGTLILLTAGVASAQRGAVSLKVLEADGGVVSLRVPLENRVIKGAPYSAEIEIENVQMLADGNRIVRRTTGRVYRDSAGRVRREEDATPGHHSVVSIFDPVAAVSYSLDDERRVAWKSPAIVKLEILKRKSLEAAHEALKKQAEALHHQKVESLEHAKAHADPSLRKKVATGDRDHHADAAKSDAAKVAASQPRKMAGVTDYREDVQPATMMEGVRVEGIRRTSTIPAGAIGNDLPITIVSEEWTSPDLQVLVMTRHSDPRVGESTYRMTSIIRAEPNQFLFQVPADYTVKETGVRKPE